MKLDAALLEILACPECQVAAARRRAPAERAGLHRLRPGLPGARRHPGAAGRRGAQARVTPHPDDVLDDAGLLEARDPGDMLRAVASSAAQVREAAALAAEAGLRPARRRGPAAVASSSAAWAGPASPATCSPRSPARRARCRCSPTAATACPPGSARPTSSSPCPAAARTEETLSALEEAVRRGCRLLVVGSPTAARSASSAGAARGVVVPVHAGPPAARVASGRCRRRSSSPAHALGLLQAPPEAVEATAVAARGARRALPPRRRHRRQPGQAAGAASCPAPLPVLWGTSPLAGVAAYRAACQLNENAKYPATWGVLPEANHNQVVAFDGPFAGRGLRTERRPLRRPRATTSSGRRAAAAPGAAARHRGAPAGRPPRRRQRRARAASAASRCRALLAEGDVAVRAAGLARRPARLGQHLPRAARGHRPDARRRHHRAQAADPLAGERRAAATRRSSRRCGANLAIAVAKFVGFLVTGSSSMLAESVHSVADSGNQGLLLLGGKRAKQAADDEHPFGYGRERYFWAFVVALVLFSPRRPVLASTRASTSCRRRATAASWRARSSRIGDPGVRDRRRGLLASAPPSASRAPLKGSQTWWRFIRTSKKPELPIVVLEDFGALIGLVLALVGVVLAARHRRPRLGRARHARHRRAAAGHRRRPRRRDARPAARRERHARAGRRDPRRRSSARASPGSSTCKTLHLGPDELLVAREGRAGRRGSTSLRVAARHRRRRGAGARRRADRPRDVPRARPLPRAPPGS